MVLTKEEIIGSLEHEVAVLGHLASKVEPGMLSYRPTAKQRSLLELLQYLAILGPIHLRGIKAPAWSMDSWRNAWVEGEATAKALSLEEARTSIARQAALAQELLSPMSDLEFREELVMFGHKASRGLWLVRLVLAHYAAYRMQLFLYLKACGRDDLNTMNLWAGMDPAKHEASAHPGS
jgi:hypothetical protein